MDWISIDESRCTACGLCSKVCLRGCLSQEDDGIMAWAGPDNCSLCGHCLAICPTGAISHKEMDMTNLAEFRGQEAVDPERFMAFVRARRSHRMFKEREVPWELLERLLDVVRYCPTGGNDQKVEVFVLKDRERVRELSVLSVEHFQRTVSQGEEALREAESRGGALSPEMSFTKNRLVKLKRILSHWDAGRDPILRDAPLVLIFNSTPQLQFAQGRLRHSSAHRDPLRPHLGAGELLHRSFGKGLYGIRARAAKVLPDGPAPGKHGL